MFEKLVELAAQWWMHITPCYTVVPSQNAGVLRLGKYHRTDLPGFHWKWPLIDELNTQDVCVTTMRVPQQTLTTMDRRTIVVGGIIKYRIKDVKPYICDILDQKDVLLDVTMGAVLEEILKRTFDEIMTLPPKKEILDLVREKVNEYGFKVMEFTFTDLGDIITVRLMQPHAKDLAN